MRRLLHVMAGLAVCGLLYAFATVATPTLPFGPFLAACLMVSAGIAAADWFAVEGSGAAQRRRRLRLCAHCGYNLHGNASGVCPECGSAAPAAPAAPAPSSCTPALPAPESAA